MALDKKLDSSFLWGFATASFQIEGSTSADGRGPSIWDQFSRTPGKTLDGGNGDVATDSYARYLEDLDLLASYGVKSYRFSIAWSRIIPKGGRGDEVNQKGIEWYSRFIDGLLERGIVPFVTLYHWDLPQELHDRYGGWLNKDECIKDFVNYARVCFQAFGDRVKHWLTFNEPWCISILGYGRGVFAPGRSSDRSRSEEGDGRTEPWIVGHNLILSHAHACKLYKEEFKPKQGGVIGITLNGDWAMPYDDSPENPEGFRAVSVPLTFGVLFPALVLPYPISYSPRSYSPHPIPHPSTPIHYPFLVVTENGFAVKDENFKPIEEAVKDHDRVEYFKGNVEMLLKAVHEDGVDIRGYYPWSFLDNFEWADGYATRFGVTYVDYTTQKRRLFGFIGKRVNGFRRVVTMSNGRNNSVDNVNAVEGVKG
ncbi:glycoside hydrolase family 1 protein [Jaapia argillacea MUCL 33604]|uniref:Glycoside hydrolase family 1 protein n=1 Tax=Jaapia argillacea MUCL 33604 TaxID=933084 RepID=A0A067PPM8_9AGAM|nr:glycoside hydrolase family 1 protein [Jaapia argillacea MUCL 33604]